MADTINNPIQLVQTVADITGTMWGFTQQRVGHMRTALLPISLHIRTVFSKILTVRYFVKFSTIDLSANTIALRSDCTVVVSTTANMRRTILIDVIHHPGPMSLTIKG